MTFYFVAAKRVKGANSFFMAENHFSHSKVGIEWIEGALQMK